MQCGIGGSWSPSNPLEYVSTNPHHTADGILAGSNAPQQRTDKTGNLSKFSDRIQRSPTLYAGSEQ